MRIFVTDGTGGTAQLCPDNLYGATEAASELYVPRQMLAGQPVYNPYHVW